MGRLIKNHWARLIVLIAAVYQIVASIEGFFFPKVFWDFATTRLDILVEPIPVLQIINILSGLTVVAFEWPIGIFAGSAVHRSIVPRILFYPLCSLFAFLMYQSTNAAVCYWIGSGIYLWALIEGEIVCAEPWTLPDAQRGHDLESGESKP